MNEYKITLNVKYNGGFLPDFFGKNILLIRKANDAQEAVDTVREEMKSEIMFSYTITDVSLV